MKNESLHKLFALCAATGLLGFAPIAAAQDDEEETPLAEAMDEMSGSLKALRRLARDPDRWSKSAESVRNGAAACIKAMAYMPAQIEKMPAGPEKAKAEADSRRLMGLTLAAYSELELAFLAEDEDKVEEIIDKLKDLKKESHERYNKED